MTTIPPTGRRLTGVVNVSSALTALTALALLGGTMSPALAQPIPVSALAGVSTAAAASSAVIGSASLSVTGTNVARGVNALIVYTAPVQDLTVVLEDGVAVQPGPGVNSAIRLRANSSSARRQGAAVPGFMRTP